MLIACHGNYHLQQVLRTEDDFTIIDFEGEPPRPLFERRLKRTPLVEAARHRRTVLGDTMTRACSSRPTPSTARPKSADRSRHNLGRFTAFL
jgi:maltose alpha-D-glucosyltransferase/alpha-amylase